MPLRGHIHTHFLLPSFATVHNIFQIFFGIYETSRSPVTSHRVCRVLHLSVGNLRVRNRKRRVASFSTCKMLASVRHGALRRLSSTAVDVNKSLANILDDAAKIVLPPPLQRKSQPRSCICPSASIFLLIISSRLAEF